MAVYNYNDFINKPVKLFNKFPLKDTVLVVVGIIIFMMLSDLITIIIPIPKMIITGIGILVFGGYIFLMVKASKKKHPSYLESLGSRIFLQPKILKVSNNKYQFDFLERRKKVEIALRNTPSASKAPGRSNTQKVDKKNK